MLEKHERGQLDDVNGLARARRLSAPWRAFFCRIILARRLGTKTFDNDAVMQMCAHHSSKMGHITIMPYNQAWRADNFSTVALLISAAHYKYLCVCVRVCLSAVRARWHAHSPAWIYCNIRRGRGREQLNLSVVSGGRSTNVCDTDHFVTVFCECEPFAQILLADRAENSVVH